MVLFWPEFAWNCYHVPLRGHEDMRISSSKEDTLVSLFSLLGVSLSDNTYLSPTVYIT